MTEQNNQGSQDTTQAGDQGKQLTPDQLHDSALATIEAYKTDPKPELLEELAKTTSKAKELFIADKKAREEALAKGKPPEKYDLKLPEGSKLDAKAIEDISVFAKANALPQDVAKALLERENSIYEAYVEGQKKQIADEQTKWLAEIKADKEIGGEKEKQSAEMSKRVLQKFAGDRAEFIKELNETGLGNHPELVRLLSRIGKAMSEDQLVNSNTGDAPAKKSIEEVMFPSMFANKA